MSAPGSAEGAEGAERAGASTGATGAVDVRRDDDASAYTCEVDGERAVAEYQRSGNTITFTHTLVPPPIEGQGVGNALVRYALDDARSNGWRVVPQCAFVKAYIERHPDYGALVQR